jgi:N-acetylglucosaminyldiphosphoundecaprenol N-acetyl-beta-D-mannosaminyltransferase
VAARAAANLTTRYPGARIAGWWSEGTPEPADDAASLERIAASGARSVAVAYGAPGQVLWIMRNQAALSDLGVRVAVGVGGALDFVAGVTPRAPRWMRAAGLEWLFRLARQPWRWRRQLALPMFALAVLREWLARLWRRGNRPGKYARPK